MKRKHILPLTTFLAKCDKNVYVKIINENGDDVCSYLKVKSLLRNKEKYGRMIECGEVLNFTVKSYTTYDTFLDIQILDIAEYLSR